MGVFVLDVIETRPGTAAAFRARFRAEYMPGAVRRGMRLDGAWQAPAADIAELPVTLYYLWSVEGVAGWWRARLSRLPDGTDERAEKHGFWLGCAPMVLSRERRMLGAQAAE